MSIEERFRGLSETEENKAHTGGIQGKKSEEKKVKMIATQSLVQKPENQRPHWMAAAWRKRHKRNQVSPRFDFLTKSFRKEGEKLSR